jgi:hypothetical protein
MKLNKCTSFLLAILILVSNIGVAFKVHYCGDEVASISLKTAFSNPNSEANCCGEMEKNSKCCHNKIVNFQKKSDFSSIKSFAFTTNYFIQNTIWHPIIFEPKLGYKNIQNTSFYCNNNAPPLYKLHHQFLFYG